MTSINLKKSTNYGVYKDIKSAWSNWVRAMFGRSGLLKTNKKQIHENKHAYTKTNTCCYKKKCTRLKTFSENYMYKDLNCP